MRGSNPIEVNESSSEQSSSDDEVDVGKDSNTLTPSSKYTNNYLVDAISDQSEYSLSEDDETYSKDVTKNNLNTIRNPSVKSTESSFSCTSSSSTESHKNIIGGIKSKNLSSRDLSKVPEKDTKQKPLLPDINKDVDLFDSDSDDDLFQTKKDASIASTRAPSNTLHAPEEDSEKNNQSLAKVVSSQGRWKKQNPTHAGANTAHKVRTKQNYKTISEHTVESKASSK